MKVSSSRWGPTDIDEKMIVTFRKGLLGFSQHQRWCLLEPRADALIFWLQSMDDPELAFAVTDPTIFVADYSVPILPEELEELKISKLDDAIVLVILNKHGDMLTGNLLGPLVISGASRQGKQLILASSKWGTRHPLLLSGARGPLRLAEPGPEALR